MTSPDLPLLEHSLLELTSGLLLEPISLLFFLHLSLGYFPGSVLTPEGLGRSLCLFLEQHASSQQSTGLPDHVVLLTAGTGFPSRGG